MRFASCEGWRAAAACLIFLCSSSAEGAALFPEPLHLRREIHDPISGSAQVVDEYCSGDRIVSVSGSRVVIADYGRGELTEIDRAESTYSITRFRDVPTPAAPAAKSAIEPRAIAPKRSFDGRMLEAYGFRRDGDRDRMTVEVAVDRRITVSAAALEALIGAAYPGVRTFAHEATLRAAAPVSGGERRTQTNASPSFALPAEQLITYELEGEKVTFRSVITAIDTEAPPPELLLIPPGSRRVESRITAVPRMLQEIERLP